MLLEPGFGAVEIAHAHADFAAEAIDQFQQAAASQPPTGSVETERADQRPDGRGK